MIRNLSFYVNDGINDGEFFVLSQGGETLYFQLIGTSLSNSCWLALFFLTLLVLSVPSNIAIVATVIKNGLNNRPVNLLILVDQSDQSTHCVDT